MTPRLWGYNGSGNVQKVLWALEELGLPFEYTSAGGKFGRVKDADYLALNPNGLVPTLEDGPLALWESNAIVRYLYAKYGKAPDYPEDLGERGRAESFHDWYAGTLWSPIRTQLFQLARTPEAERDPKLIEQSKTASLAALAILERELGKHPYVAGRHFTYGDIPIGKALQRWFVTPLADRPHFPNVEAYYARLAERPGFKKHITFPI